MSSKGTNHHNKRLPSETEHAQRVPDTDSAQQMRLRERQRFFEEVFQHDVDVYLSSAHLQIDYKRPPLGSISSMEVNVDMLEQMDLMDISDQEALDVFFSASGEEGSLTSPLPDLVPIDCRYMTDRLQRFELKIFGVLLKKQSHLHLGCPGALSHTDIEEDGLRSNDLSLRISDPCEGKSRILSTSSNSTCDSQASNEDGSNTPVVQSDDEDVHEDNLLRTGSPTASDATKEQSGLSL